MKNYGSHQMLFFNEGCIGRYNLMCYIFYGHKVLATLCQTLINSQLLYFIVASIFLPGGNFLDDLHRALNHKHTGKILNFQTDRSNVPVHSVDTTLLTENHGRLETGFPDLECHVVSLGHAYKNYKSKLKSKINHYHLIIMNLHAEIH